MPSTSGLRILHIGNIANNAYNIVKALRERTDIEADCYTNYYRHYISQPEWEDADIGIVPCSDPMNWEKVDLRGFQRPAWYFETRSQILQQTDSFRAKELLRILSLVQTQLPDRTILNYWKNLVGCLDRIGQPGLGQLQLLAQGKMPCNGGRFPTAQAWEKYLQETFAHLCQPVHVTPLSRADCEDTEKDCSDIFKEYDIIQTYGIWELFHPLLHSPSVPRVTFEHGTMREFPFQDSALGRKAMFAYKSAFANIITNADAIYNARRMGLQNYTFIPHPVDDTKFCPKPDSNFREALLREHDASHLFVALARQNWELKGNDRIVRAFAIFIRKVGSGPKLLLGAWGQEVSRTQALVRQLNLEKHVAWIPPLPKRLLAKYINASDAVLDQFILGAFGTTTPEALACAKPVLLYYAEQAHQWCLPEAPPVINVREVSDIAQALEKIYRSPAYAIEVGQKSLLWFRQYHSIDLVIRRHLDIYEKIQHSPCCIHIPIQKMEHLMEQFVLCIVTCPALEESAAQPYLQGIDGCSIVEIMDARLRAIAPNCIIVLSLHAHLPTLEREAARLGWKVAHKRGGLWEKCRKFAWDVFKNFRRVELIWECSLSYPFLDKDTLVNWHRHFDNTTKIISGFSQPEENPYIPQRIYTKNFMLYRFLLRFLFRKHFTDLQCTSIMVRYGMHIAAPVPPADVLRLNTINFLVFNPRLSPQNFTVADLQALPKGRDYLAESLRSARKPHLLNTALNDLEMKERNEVLRSFPPFVGLNLTSKCSARCTFCSIQPQEQKIKDSMSLADIKKMDWLRYVETLAIWGGIGDSLVNKDFLPIVRYLRETHPHLKLTLSTNGILLTEEICLALAGNLAQFNISLNAARKETWERLMRAKGFENVCNMFEKLARLRPDENSPNMRLSMVLAKENIHEAVEFVELAHRLGANGVTFVHYMPSTVLGRRDLPANQSLYHCKGVSDATLYQAYKKADALKLECSGPTLFDKHAKYIHFGARALTEAPICTAPWKTCYLTVNEDGERQMIFCCSGFYYEIPYDKSELGEKNFLKIWNHPTAQYFRRTVNLKRINPVCEHCTTVDRFNPEHTQIYRINEQILPVFKKIQVDSVSGAVNASSVAAALRDIKVQ